MVEPLSELNRVLRLDVATDDRHVLCEMKINGFFIRNPFGIHLAGKSTVRRRLAGEGRRSRDDSGKFQFA